VLLGRGNSEVSVVLLGGGFFFTSSRILFHKLGGDRNVVNGLAKVKMWQREDVKVEMLQISCKTREEGDDRARPTEQLFSPRWSREQS